MKELMVGIIFQLVPDAAERYRINSMDIWGTPSPPPPPHGDLVPSFYHMDTWGPPPSRGYLGTKFDFMYFYILLCIAFSQIIGKGVLIFTEKIVDS